MRTTSKAIAFYDTKGKSYDLEALYHKVIPYAEYFGVEWTSIELSSARKVLQFKSGHSRLLKKGFDISTYISLYGGQYERGVNNLWKITADINPEFNQVYFCYNDDKSIDEVFVRRVINDFSQHLDFDYGIALDWNKGRADHYIYGAISGEMSDEEEIKITLWRREYRRNDGDYRTGDLRDIYPYNILTSAHLDRQIFPNQTLEQWILSSADHGSLEKVTDKHMLWRVPEDKIPEIQETLDPTGILIAYNVDNY